MLFATVSCADGKELFGQPRRVDPEARAYAPQIAPRWIAPDGKSFWLVWADLKGMLKFSQDEPLLDAQMSKAATPEQRGIVQAECLRRYMPGYSFNAQRVDLI